MICHSLKPKTIFTLKPRRATPNRMALTGKSNNSILKFSNLLDEISARQLGFLEHFKATRDVHQFVEAP